MELLRWAVALTIYPFLWLSDIRDRREEERYLAWHKQHMIDLAEGE